MTTLIVYSIVVMTFAGLYLLLSGRLWKVVIGTVFLSHSANLLLLSSGGYLPEALPPILRGDGPFMDPLPQALILTAIVISFGVTTLLLVVLRQVYMTWGTTDLKDLETRGWRGEGNGDE